MTVNNNVQASIKVSESNWLNLAGKTAVVVGGGQGIGEASVRHLAEAGCKVCIVDLDAARAEAVAGEVRARGAHALALRADIMDDRSIVQAIEACENGLGVPDVLVTVVGQAKYVPSLELTLEDWDIDHRRNLRYVFVAARAFAAIQVRRKKPGAIVAISSVSGLQSAPSHVAYGAAKAGLVNMVKSLGDEWAQYGVRVNSIAPGTIVTPRRPNNQDWEDRLASSPLPMKHRGHVDDIAKAVLYLASDMSSYVTGETLAVDGGWMAANLMKRKD